MCFQAAAELERRKENFTKEMDFVVANVVCLLVNKIYSLLLLY